VKSEADMANVEDLRMAVEVSSEADEATLGFDARNRNEASSDDGAHEIQEEGDEKSKNRRHEDQEKFDYDCEICEDECSCWDPTNRSKKISCKGQYVSDGDLRICHRCEYEYC